MHVVVIGAGLGGLAAAVAAGRVLQLTLEVGNLELDRGGVDDDGAQAVAAVPQHAQSHRATELSTAHGAPPVVGQALCGSELSHQPQHLSETTPSTQTDDR